MAVHKVTDCVIFCGVVIDKLLILSHMYRTKDPICIGQNVSLYRMSKIERKYRFKSFIGQKIPYYPNSLKSKSMILICCI